MRPEITRNTERVLAFLLRDPKRPTYGLELSKEAGVAIRSLYPLLQRLEAAGWLESEWEAIDPAVEGRPQRRYYSLTPEGLQGAREVVEEAGAHLRGLRLDWGNT
jgi:DNA-binding PadR family transcriptional regulator